MDLYSNLLNFIDRANQIKPSLGEYENLIAQAPQEQEYIPTVNTATQQNYISPLQAQPVQIPQTVPQFRPVISQQKIKASKQPVKQLSKQPTLQNILPQTGDPKILQFIKKYFPKEQWSNAVAIMNAESGGRNIPSQFNKYGTEDSHGAFQINLQAHPQMRGKVNIPEENVKYAAQLFNQSGWQPWYNSAKRLGLL